MSPAERELEQQRLIAQYLARRLRASIGAPRAAHAVQSGQPPRSESSELSIDAQLALTDDGAFVRV
jgi:hypothetical protein